MNAEFFTFYEVQQQGFDDLFAGFSPSAKVHKSADGSVAVGDLDGYTSEELGGTYWEAGTAADYID